MSEMKEFAVWFLYQLPNFLMSEPFCYFVGLAFLIVIVSVVRNIITISK